MKTALLKTTLMLIATAVGLSLATPVVAHAATPATKITKKKHTKKKKKKAVAVSSKTSKIESGSAHLADTSASSLKPSKKAGKNLTNDVVFDGSVVRGQYQIADGTTSVVENEKSLTSLIAPRRDFKDRMQAERSQQ